MNAIRHLLKEHEEIGKLFNQFVDAGEEAYQQKQTIAEKVIEEIEKHARLEDEILFPALKEKGGEEGEEMALEGEEEHEVTRFMLDRLRKTKAEDKKFNPRFKALMESAKHHFMEEEREIFPKAKKALKGELNRLGKEMEALEKQMK
jgi:hemerythrin-like domain-containing protein